MSREAASRPEIPMLCAYCGVCRVWPDDFPLRIEAKCAACYYAPPRTVQGARPWVGLLYDFGRALRSSAPELVAVVLAGVILAVYFTWCAR